MLDRFFRLSENGTTARTELLAGLTTFLTMAYIIVVQPAVLSGRMSGVETGMDFNSVMTATCLSAAIATAIMGLYARYPIAQAPGMGENFFFVVTLLPAAAGVIAAGVASRSIEPGSTTPWQIGLGVVFYSGVLFLLLSLFGVREALLDAVSPSMRNGIAAGIGLFIAFIGLQNAGLVVAAPGTLVTMSRQFASPDLVVFFFGLFVTGVLYVLRVRGAIISGMVAATALALVLHHGLGRVWPTAAQSPLVAQSKLETQFAPAAAALWHAGPVARQFAPAALWQAGPLAMPSLAPTLLKLDLVHSLAGPMLPFIVIFLFMVLFDTLGTLIGVTEQAGLVKDNKLPRARQALMSDAIGTVAGAALGTSTVTSFVESAAGVEQGGRTGLTAIVVAALFLVAIVFSPLVAMVGSYPSITAPALVVVGSLMMRNVAKIDWENYAEALPSFLILIGIPMTFSIADGLALGFIAYPVVKLFAGQGRQVKWLMYVMAVVLAGYFVLVAGG
ncbi:MAG: NCS2 family permease [Thermoguttaceae bacterium]|jgi:AGZA family xanthine/uracil permease-like MFS transporter